MSARAGSRGKYQFCWWCSRKLVARAHHTLTRPGLTVPVLVHACCAEDMMGEGWHGYVAPDQVADPAALIAV